MDGSEYATVPLMLVAGFSVILIAALLMYLRSTRLVEFWLAEAAWERWLHAWALDGDGWNAFNLKCGGRAQEAKDRVEAARKAME